jgi:hypothetical protein
MEPKKRDSAAGKSQGFVETLLDDFISRGRMEKEVMRVRDRA